MSSSLFLFPERLTVLSKPRGRCGSNLNHNVSRHLHQRPARTNREHVTFDMTRNRKKAGPGDEIPMAELRPSTSPLSALVGSAAQRALHRSPCSMRCSAWRRITSGFAIGDAIQGRQTCSLPDNPLAPGTEVASVTRLRLERRIGIPEYLKMLGADALCISDGLGNPRQPIECSPVRRHFLIGRFHKDVSIERMWRPLLDSGSQCIALNDPLWSQAEHDRLANRVIDVAGLDALSRLMPRERRLPDLVGPAAAQEAPSREKRWVEFAGLPVQRSVDMVPRPLVVGRTRHTRAQHLRVVNSCDNPFSKWHRFWHCRRGEGR